MRAEYDGEYKLDRNERKRGVFTSPKIVDSVTGTETTYKKDPSLSVKRRIDEIPGQRISRTITQYDHSDPALRRKLYCVAYEDNHNSENTITLGVHPLNEIPVELTTMRSVDHPQLGYLWHSLHYQENGQLDYLQFHIGSPDNLNDQFSSLNIFEKFDYFYTKPLNRNLDEMVEIYRLRGEVILIGLTELDDDISAKKSAESIFVSDIKENQSHLTETELRILSGEVTNFIQFILEKGIKTELAPKENQTLVHWLSLQVIRSLPKGFIDPQEKLKLFLDQLRQEVATLLGSYYENLHSIGDCSMVLRWKEGVKEQPLIGTVEEDATDRSQLIPSQGLSLSEYFFKLDKSTEDKFTFLIQKRGRQALTLAVCFSPQVDIEKYYALLTAENSTVWSQVLNNLPLKELDY